jgi:predicted kinase
VVAARQPKVSTVRREIILVSGAPGSGKSTLSLQLATSLQWPLIAKDVIKESLWDTFSPPSGDLEWSRRLGGAAMEILWTLAGHSPRVVLEANFRPQSEYERSKLVELEAAIVEVYCWCPPEESMRRYAARAAGPAHHPAHVTPVLDPTLLAEFNQPVGIGTLIRVDTTVAVDADALVAEINTRFSAPATTSSRDQS